MKIQILHFWSNKNLQNYFFHLISIVLVYVLFFVFYFRILCFEKEVNKIFNKSYFLFRWDLNLLFWECFFRHFIDNIIQLLKLRAVSKNGRNLFLGTYSFLYLLSFLWAFYFFKMHTLNMDIFFFTFQTHSMQWKYYNLAKI